MGGEMRVESVLGVGSTFFFTVTLPLATEASSDSGVVQKVALQGRRILVVDDNATNRRVLTGQLESAGCIVQAVTNAGEAMSAALAAHACGFPFNVAVLDEQMPGQDGSALGEAIAREPKLTSMRLVMLTSLDSDSKAERVAARGFAGYLIKPVRGVELRACVARVLGAVDTSGTGKHTRLVTRGTLADEAITRESSGSVLLVEDLAVNQEVARRFLERLGWDVTVAADGAAAVEAFGQRQFDLVLMDVQMPVMDGLTATREIRRLEPPGTHTPIVALTASAMSGELERCRDAGMDEMLTKPIEFARLRATLEAHAVLRPTPPTVYPAGPLDGASTASTRAVTTTDEPPLDLAKLHASVGDDSEFLTEIFDVFVASGQDLLRRLDDAFRAEDRALLASTAHKLKGTSASLYAGRMTTLAHAIEVGARTEPLSSLRTSFEALRLAFDDCVKVIEALPRPVTPESRSA